MPKFSVLLPTRNRLELLQYAVQSVLRQQYDDWEIIISDNFSDEDIAGYVHSLNDDRIRYYRTESFVPVTDNWNNSLRYATGDYIIMLGDDDCLMSDFFKTMNDLIKNFDSPDLIYTDAYLFGYPGVLPDFPSGYLRYPYGNYFRSGPPTLLDRDSSLEIVKKSLSLRICIHYNMQLSVISKKFIATLSTEGTFFQSLFPDFYATVAAFFKAERILIYPQPTVVIGISSKSYGFFHFNNTQEGGQSLLYNSVSEQRGEPPQTLPGSWINTGWLSAMHSFQTNYDSELRALGLQVDYRHYRHLQIIYGYKNHYADKRISVSDFMKLTSKMRPEERLKYELILGIPFRLIGWIPLNARKQLLAFIRRLSGRKDIFAEQNRHVSEFKTVLDVYEKMPPRIS